MNDCLFCKIAAKQIPAHLLYEDQHVCAFLDINPRAPGNTVVIPKAHAETLAALPENEASFFFSVVQRLSGEIRRRMKADGLTIGVNEGKASGQAVDHLHLHIMPRFAGDGGGSVHSVVSNISSESLDTIANKLKI